MIGTHRLHVSEYDFVLPGLPSQFHNLRLVHLTDIHHGPWMPVEFLRDVVQITNSLNPDLVAMTGDFVVNSPRYIQPMAEELSHLSSRFGSVAVLGNHDWWEGGELVQAALRSIGVCLVDNARCCLTLDGQLVSGTGEGALAAGGCALTLAGVGDCWAHCVDLGQALDGLPDDIPCILLSHNPEVAEDPCFVDSRWRVDLMLSGHTHGGQVRPHIRGARAVRPRRRLRHAHGLVQGPRFPVYISRGIGTAGVPLRVNMPPEIALFRLRAR